MKVHKILFFSATFFQIIFISGVGEMQGVIRVIIFCIMVVILPTILIIMPLYLRHYVFGNVTYSVAESDVLAIQDGVSSIFCKSLSLSMNSTYNAFQIVGTPKITGKRKHIRLKKSMTLPDDTIEYWGFYLLKGALVRLKVSIVWKIFKFYGCISCAPCNIK